MEKMQEKEVDLIALFHKIWKNKKYIGFIVLLAILIGGIIAFSKPKEYTSVVTFTANSTGNPLSGNVGMLASFAGFNMSASSSEGISSELFSDVLKSSKFIEGCFLIQIEDQQQGIKSNLHDYFLNQQKNPWYLSLLKSPFLLLKMFSPKNEVHKKTEASPLFISQDDMDVIKSLNNAYNINIDKKTNLITFAMTTQSPVISAFLADTITSKLQSFLIEFKIKKAQDDLKNAEYLFKQAEFQYNNDLLNMAEYTDKNKNVVSAQYQIKQQELQNQLSLSYNVYTQMAQQVQACKIAIQNQKPVFSIIQPAFEPLVPSSPNKKMIIIGFAFLGFVGACIWILKKDFIEILKG